MPLAYRAFLVQSYADAFQILTYILIAITFISAAIVFGFLGRAPSPAIKPDLEGAATSDALLAMESRR